MFSEKHDSLVTGDSERELLDILNGLRQFFGTLVAIRIGFETFLGFLQPFFKISSFYFPSWRVEDRFFDRGALRAVSRCSLAKVRQ